jgi:hypothetical protein
MAQSFTTDDGSILIIPGAYPQVKVQKTNAGLAAVGVLALVGEADAGPDHSAESDLSEVFFGPDQEADVVAKYKSGNLVDAFRAAVAAANDPAITGAPTGVYLLKTNVSGKAQSEMDRAGLTDYAVLADKTYGKTGNFLYWNVQTDTAESAPTTGNFVYVPFITLTAPSPIWHVNGGTALSHANIGTTGQSPNEFVRQINVNLTGVMATGGTNRNVLSSFVDANTLALNVTAGNDAVITGSVAWGTNPTAGDILIIAKATDGITGVAQASVLLGAGNANWGAWIVTSATNTTINVTKIRDMNAATVTAPANVVATAVDTEHTDILVFAPVVVKNMTGTNRSILTGKVGNAISCVASGSTLTVTLASGWASRPQIGDIAYLASTATGIAGAATASPAPTANENVGWWEVTSSTTTTVTLNALNGQTPGNDAGTVQGVTDLVVYRPTIDGTGKTMEIAGTSLTDFVKTTGGAAVSWISTAGSPYVITSTAEQTQTLNVLRSTDTTNEEITEGGTVVLKLGYEGSGASTVTITNTQLSTSVTGGTGTNQTLLFKDFTTVAALATYLNNQTGYTCEVGSALVGQLPLQKVFLVADVQTKKSVLDLGTYGILGTYDGAMPCRIKHDAYAFNEELMAVSASVQLGTDDDGSIKRDQGLPESTIDPVTGQPFNTFLSGGTKGSTTNTLVDGAIDACESLRLNFLVTLFSQDATDDIAENLTESGSTYTIDSINALVKTHVIKMSTTKRRRHRQGCVSKRGSFTEAKTAANNLANYRVNCAFQDVKQLDSTATIKQFHPWMGSVLAAGMQAAAFNKSILNKGINCSGILMGDGSFNDQLDSDLESALKNGLLVARRTEDGRLVWVADQTTYATDSNFVYNSMQAIYCADIVSLSTAQRMERAFVGESLADVSATAALSFLKGVMLDFLRLKLTVGDDEAPLGFRNARIQISGNTMKVSLEVKLATAIVFIPISFLVTEVQSSAG